MHYLKTGFSLISLAACLGFAFDANAAPSVRVLGSGAGYSTAGSKAAPGTTATAVNTGNNISSSVLGANAGAKKSASIKTIAPKTASVAPTPQRISSNRAIGTPATVKTAATQTNTERFPGIVTKSNIQNVGKVGTAATIGQQTATTGGGYNVKEMSDRLTDVEGVLDSKVDTSKLDEYYTKDYIDENYLLKDDILERIDAVTNDTSAQHIQKMRDDIDENRDNISRLFEMRTGVYDTNSQEDKSVYIENFFDADTVLGAE